MAADHPLVRAVLGVMPLHPEDGDTLTSWQWSKTRSLRSGARMVPITEAMYGPPGPLAARYAATVLRAAARDLGLVLCAEDAAALDRTADEIEQGDDGG